MLVSTQTKEKNRSDTTDVFFASIGDCKVDLQLKH